MKIKETADVSLTDEDLQAALIEMKTYVDVTLEDLKKIYEIALQHSRRQRAAHVPVKKVMTKRVVTVNAEADLHEAAQMLFEHNIGGMPVVDKNNRVLGVISEADLLVLAGMQKEHTFKDLLRKIMGEAVSSGKSGETVHEVMSSPAITCKPDDELGSVAKALDAHRIKRLPVVDDDGKLVGIISRADIIRLIGTS